MRFRGFAAGPIRHLLQGHSSDARTVRAELRHLNSHSHMTVPSLTCRVLVWYLSRVDRWPTLTTVMPGMVTRRL